MKPIESLLKKSFEMNAHELWLAPDQPIRARVGKQWKEISGQGLSNSDLKNQLSAMLSDFDRRDFFENESWTGAVCINDQTYNAQLQISREGFVASLSWKSADSQNIESWNLPVHFMDLLLRSRGLTLVAGPRASGKSCLIEQLAEKAVGSAEHLVHLYSNQNLMSSKKRLTTFSLKALKNAHLNSADLIFIDEPEIQDWSQVLNLAESGRQVIMSIQSLDLFSALERWTMFHRQSNRSAFTSLQIGIGTRLLAGIETNLVPALELLFAHQQMRNALESLDWSKVAEYMKSQAEKTGMRTLDQSLLQLLLRRKVEMRVAFQESKNPDEFDLLLKKVGI